VDGHQLALGNTTLMAAHAVDVTPMQAPAEERRAAGASVMFLAVDGAWLACSASPTDRESTPQALAQLRAAGMQVIMATGDGTTTAAAVARRLGIESSTARFARRTSSTWSIAARTGPARRDGRRRHQRRACTGSSRRRHRDGHRHRRRDRPAPS
jgi:hypothetical protein